MRLLAAVFAIVLLLWPVSAQAQVTTTSMLTWDAPANATSAAQASGFTYKVFDKGALVDTFVGAACTGSAAPFKCSKALTTVMVIAFNAIGQHSITMSATDVATGGGESAQTAVPFPLAAPPAAPTGLGITR